MKAGSGGLDSTEGVGEVVVEVAEETLCDAVDSGEEELKEALGQKSRRGICEGGYKREGEKKE